MVTEFGVLISMCKGNAETFFEFRERQSCATEFGRLLSMEMRAELVIQDSGIDVIDRISGESKL